ncbi:hypothetical protein [Clostridium oceanicum]|uniref:Uncharacterized protein n=1 Tax=Clostridium oceanicum TaxID=1543 RepID=A0ABP3UVK7_9CLOT
MLDIIKGYMKVETEGKYSKFVITEIVRFICYGIIFFMIGKEGRIFGFNIFIFIIYSAVAMLFSCEHITNKSYIDVNKKIPKEEKFYKRVLISNIAMLTDGFQYVLPLIIVNIYFLGFIKSIELLVQFISLIMLASGIGNLNFVYTKNFTSKVKKNILIFMISAILALIFNYINYKLGWIALLPLTLIVYPLSLKKNENMVKL